jgi:hypothetical protein
VKRSIVWTRKSRLASTNDAVTCRYIPGCFTGLAIHEIRQARFLVEIARVNGLCYLGREREGNHRKKKPPPKVLCPYILYIYI